MSALMIVCAVLAVGCIVADKLFPRIPAVERFIQRLPLATGEKSEGENKE